MRRTDEDIHKLEKPMVWSGLPSTSVQLGKVLMHSHAAHMPQPTMCSPVANS